MPTLFLVPKLYGKIEPLLGMQPRTAETALPTIGPKMIVGCGAAFVGAVVAEFLAETGSELIEWKAEWAESTGAMAIAMLVAAVVVVVVLVVPFKKADDSKVQKIK